MNSVNRIKWSWAVFGIVIIVTVAAVAGYLLTQNIAASARPMMDLVGQIQEPKDRVTAQKDVSAYQVDAQTKVLTALAQSAGAAILTVGALFTWANLRATHAKLDIDREGQITNRFTQAVAQLGAESKDGQPSIEVRLGGIYALERVARDSPRDYWPIMEVLTGYVRQHAVIEASSNEDESGDPVVRYPSPPRTDIQAALTVIGRRLPPQHEPDPGRLDLANTNLILANLQHGRFSDASFERAHLDQANLEKAQLQRVNLKLADMVGADLEAANLEGAFLPFAKLRRAILIRTRLERSIINRGRLEGADLTEAHLENASLLGAQLQTAKLIGARLDQACLMEVRLDNADLTDAHLEGADLTRAHLNGAKLRGAYLGGSVLRGASFEGADLAGARLDGASLWETRGLTRDQVAQASTLPDESLLPPHLKDPSSLPVDPHTP